MNKYKILLIVTVLIGSGGQIAMKLGTTSMGGFGGFDGVVEMALALFLNPYIIAGLFCTGASMLLWLTVISKLDLSFAYPFMSLSYVVVLLFGWLAMDEKVVALRVCGIGCIMAGVFIISRTGGAE